MANSKLTDWGENFIVYGTYVRASSEQHTKICSDENSLIFGMFTSLQNVKKALHGKEVYEFFVS